MTERQAIEAAAKVDQMVRDRLGSAYEVFHEDGSLYISAPLDEDESESTDCPTCVYIMSAEDCADEDELYMNALHASADVDRSIQLLERDGLR